MAEFKHEKLGVRLVVPDRPNVLQQSSYYSQAALATGDELFQRLWQAACTLITEWECALIPDFKGLSLAAEDDPKITRVIVWVGMQVKVHLDKLESIPKN